MCCLQMYEPRAFNFFFLMLQRIGPIIEKDGKVRHVKGVGEEIKDQPKGILCFKILDIHLLVDQKAMPFFF